MQVLILAILSLFLPYLGGFSLVFPVLGVLAGSGGIALALSSEKKNEGMKLPKFMCIIGIAKSLLMIFAITMGM